MTELNSIRGREYTPLNHQHGRINHNSNDNKREIIPNFEVQKKYDPIRGTVNFREK